MTAAIEHKDLEWLVDSRSKIQRLLFKLLTFASRGSKSTDSQTLQFQLLMAAGFALWRAAFLADGERSWSTIDGAATEFLKILVRDNSIGYVQDRGSKAWTFGYYVNDAYFRLAYFHTRLGRLQAHHAERVEAYLDAQSTKRQDEPNAHVAWDHAYEAVADIVENLSVSR